MASPNLEEPTGAVRLFHVYSPTLGVTLPPLSSFIQSWAKSLNWSKKPVATGFTPPRELFGPLLSTFHKFPWEEGAGALIYFQVFPKCEPFLAKVVVCVGEEGHQLQTLLGQSQLSAFLHWPGCMKSDRCQPGDHAHLALPQGATTSNIWQLFPDPLAHKELK